MLYLTGRRGRELEANQEDTLKSERNWAGIICGFFLFIVVCLSLLLHMKGAFGPAAS
jgi:hypothetical protein